MRASKEECSKSQQSIEEIERLADRLCQPNAGVNAADWRNLRRNFEQLRRFLNAAHKRLPTEASYVKDKNRRFLAKQGKRKVEPPKKKARV